MAITFQRCVSPANSIHFVFKRRILLNIVPESLAAIACRCMHVYPSSTVESSPLPKKEPVIPHEKPVFTETTLTTHNDTTSKNSDHAGSSTLSEGGYTHFGFEEVPVGEKEHRVNKVFTNVAESYDMMNDAMSFGIHRLWKDQFVRRISPTRNIKLLDVAGGTGDIAFRVIRYALAQQQTTTRLRHAGVPRRPASQTSYADTVSNTTSQLTSTGVNKENYLAGKSHASSVLNQFGGQSGTEKRLPLVSVCDINESMLRVGERRAEKEKFGASGADKDELLRWIVGDAERLPFEDDLYDVYSIAFGIRNVTNIQQALHEAYRVLKPHGRFVCLEFSHVKSAILEWLYEQYSFQVIPPLGLLLAQDWNSYQYLVESIRMFPSQEEFADMIRDAGFKAVTYENMTNGLVAIHSGFKI